MDVECSIGEIRNQLKNFPTSLDVHDQLNRLESERTEATGRPYRAGVKQILKSLFKRIEKRSKKKKKRKDCLSKVYRIS